MCRNPLIFKNRRDLTRKRFCSRTCIGIAVSQTRGREFMRRLWQKCNTPAANHKKAHPGAFHPQWIADRTLVKECRSRLEERRFIAEVLQERGYTCELTGKIGGRLSVHHINPVWSHPEQRFDRNNVIVIKRSIHQAFHRKYGAKWGDKTKWIKFVSNSEYAKCQ